MLEYDGLLPYALQGTELVEITHVFQDCLFCPYQFSIEYENVWKGDSFVPGEPKCVRCWGKSKDFIYSHTPD